MASNGHQNIYHKNKNEKESANQQFLDSNQYTHLSISRYEKIFGKTFVSTGGADTTRALTKKLSLKAGDRVLDVGCGLGGSAFFMARSFGASVLGLDLSQNMIARAKQYLDDEEPTIKRLVEFRVEDVLEVELPLASFDVVYSRDAILHIGDKEKLFKRLYNWVKPGGQLLITDYCRGRPVCSEEFENYVAGREYRLLTVSGYGQLLRDAGWEQVQNIDNTDEFVSIMKKELQRLETIKESFIKEFSKEDYEEINGGWNKKLRWVANEDHAWGLFMARKPM